jgi:hypothetical protein
MGRKKYMTKDTDVELAMEEVVQATEGSSGLCGDERVRWWIYSRVDMKWDESWRRALETAVFPFRSSQRRGGNLFSVLLN